MSDSLVKKLILLKEALEKAAIRKKASKDDCACSNHKVKSESECDSCSDLAKSMSNSGLGGLGSVKAGAVLPNKTLKIKKPGHNSIASKVKIPSVAPQSNKDPAKSIQQIQNKDIKDLKMKEAHARFGEVMKALPNGQWVLEKKRCWKGYEPTPGKKPYEEGSCKPKSLSKSEDEEHKEAKPAFDGSYHGQVHERMTERGHKVVRFPAKLPDGSTEMRGRKIPLKVKVKHTWDDHKKQWVHSGNEVMNPGSKVDSDAPARSYPPQNAKTMEDVAKEKMEAFNKPTTESKPKTVVRKLKKTFKVKPFSSPENRQILEPMAARIDARKQIKDKTPDADVNKLIPEPDLSKLKNRRKRS